jgi:hypothetical protein
MRAANNFSLTQLVERIDELEDMALKIPNNEPLIRRIEELRSQFNKRSQPNFNKGIVNPLPPESVDLQNKSIITPKSPDQYEREHREWEHRLQVS